MESRISPSNALKVDADRLWATIDRSAKIGRFRGTELLGWRCLPRTSRYATGKTGLKADFIEGTVYQAQVDVDKVDKCLV